MSQGHDGYAKPPPHGHAPYPSPSGAVAPPSGANYGPAPAAHSLHGVAPQPGYGLAAPGQHFQQAPYGAHAPAPYNGQYAQPVHSNYGPAQYPQQAPTQYAQSAHPHYGQMQLPPQQGYGGHARNAHAQMTALPCPCCGQMTTNLKHYTMLKFFIFLYVFAFWRRQVHTACPSCMRKELALKALINLVPANVLWPVIVLPWHAVLFFMTFADGHSAKVRAAMMEP